MKQCEKCGQAVEDSAAFCTNCGAVLSGVSAQAPSESASQGGINTNFAPMDTNTSSGVESAPVDNMASPVVAAMPETKPEKKGLDGKMIAMIAVSAICLIVGVVGIILATTGGSRRDNGGQVAVDDGDGGATVDVVTSGTKVEYAGYEFAIPDGYEYELSDEYDETGETLVVSDSDDYIAAISYYEETTYATIESNFSALETYMQQEGVATSATSGKSTIDGLDYLYVDAKGVEGYDIVYVFSKADLYSFMTMIITNQGVDGVQYLPNVAKIVGSAQKKVKMSRAIGNETDNTAARSLINGALLKLD